MRVVDITMDKRIEMWLCERWLLNEFMWIVEGGREEL